METALMLPVLLVITFGSIDLAQYINSGQVVVNASREAARAAARQDTGSTSEVTNTIEDHLLTCLPNLSEEELQSALTIEIQRVNFSSSDSDDGDDDDGGDDASDGGDDDSNGKGKGKSKGKSKGTATNTTVSTNASSTSRSASTVESYSSIPNGDLSTVPSGASLSIKIEFDFDAIRWLDGVPYPKQITETIFRRE